MIAACGTFLLILLISPLCLSALLNYDYNTISRYEPATQKATLLIKYPFMPAHEFPDAKLWTYNNKAYATYEYKHIFTAWRTYPARPIISCLLRHNIVANETIQGPFYNVSFVGMHFIGEDLYALANTQDGSASHLYKVDREKLVVTAILDLTKYGPLGTANVVDESAKLLYFTTISGKQQATDKLLTINLKDMTVTVVGSLAHFPQLSNLKLYKGNLYSIYNNKQEAASHISVLTLDTKGQFIHEYKIDQPTDVAILYSSVLVPQAGQIVFTYGDSFSSFGHRTHTCVFNIEDQKMIDYVGNYVVTPYELINVPL
jgi:hypothetical protein